MKKASVQTTGSVISGSMRGGREERAWMVPDAGRHFDKLLEPVGRPLGVGDVAAEERAAAVELEVEVAPVRLGLREELDATVLPDRVEVLRSQAAHVAVLDAEEAVNAVGVIEQPGGGAGAVVAAFGTEVLDLQGVRLLPEGVLPRRIKLRRGGGPSNGVVHPAIQNRIERCNAERARTGLA